MLGWGTILNRAIMEGLTEVTFEQRHEKDAVVSHADI